jgi:hypothetical protein
MANRNPSDSKNSQGREGEAHPQGDNQPAPVEVIAGHPPAQQHGDHDDKGSSNRNRNRESWWPWLTRGTRPFTAIVAASAVVNLVVAAYQWRAMESQSATMIAQNELMTDLAWLERRPWINIEMPILKELVADKPLEFEFTARNSGPTPAYVTQTLFHINNSTSAIGVKGLSYEPPPEMAQARPEIVGVVPPGEPYTGEPDAKHVLTQRELKQIQDGLLFLLVVIRLDYKDGQGKAHHSWLAVTYDPDRQRFGGRGKFRHMD